ncbi:MAG: hypothetical protein KAQ94_09695 [Arcobacteraceae bacterium]|nr:hypothetical protein [Arcobacteraceae bacterium]
MIDMTSHMMSRISNLNAENERISYQMSTGKSLENGSDDVVKYSKLLDIEDNIRVYEGLEIQINKTTAQNAVSDSSMDEIKTTIDLIKVDLLKSLNAGMDDSAKTAIATNLEGLRENLFSIANTTVDGEYIFTGSQTTKQTFTKDANFDANGKVDFGGDAFLRSVAVEPNTYRERGVTAYDVLMYNTSTAGDGGQLSFNEAERIIDENGNEWKLNSAKDKIQQYDRNGVLEVPAVEVALTTSGTQTTYTTAAGAITGTRFLEAKHNFFDELNIMINALQGYATEQDATSADYGKKTTTVTSTEMEAILRTSLDNTSQQFDATNIGHAELGGRNNIFNIALERIETKSVHYNILMQEVGGADLSKLAMESKSLEMTYQALYSTVSKMYSLSLMNFLK